MGARRTACGDDLVREGDSLVVRASFPIEGLEPSRYRPPILVVDGERFALDRVDGTAGRPIYSLHLSNPGLYELEGNVFFYDDERHLEAERERRHVALGWMLWIPTIPFLPLLGLLPASAKDKLVSLGVDPARATRASLAIEWLLLTFGMIGYPFTGGFFTPLGAAVGVLNVIIAADIAYRVAADFDNQTPGMFGIVVDVMRWVRETIAFWRADREKR